MPQPMTLGMIGALTLAGVGVGTWAGRAAIAEINPAYFQGSDDRFHADRVPYRTPGWAEDGTAVTEDVQLAQGLGDGCLTCGAAEIALPPAPLPAVFEERWGHEAVTSETAALVVEAEPDPDLERVQRYASYPVSAEEAEAARQPQPAPEEELPAGDAEGL